MSSETLDRFYKMADEKRVPLCEMLELALEALEREGDMISAQDFETKTEGRADAALDFDP